MHHAAPSLTPLERTSAFTTDCPLRLATLSDGLRQLIENPGLRASMSENSLRLIFRQGFEENIAGLCRALSIAASGFPYRSLAVLRGN